LFEVEAEYGCGYISTDEVLCYAVLEPILLRWKIIRRFEGFQQDSLFVIVQGESWVELASSPEKTS